MNQELTSSPSVGSTPPSKPSPYSRNPGETVITPDLMSVDVNPDPTSPPVGTMPEVGAEVPTEAPPPVEPKRDPKAALEEIRKAATLLQYRRDGKNVDALPDRVERLPDLPGNFADLPDTLRAWLHTQLSELGQDGILHHLAIQMLSNNRLAGRILELDVLLHTGNRRERRARIKKMVRKGVTLTHGV